MTDRVFCKECRKSVLPATAERCDGLCKPCYTSKPLETTNLKHLIFRAEDGNAKACHMLSEMYKTGNRAPKDQKRAEYYLELAHKHGGRGGEDHAPETYSIKENIEMIFLLVVICLISCLLFIGIGSLMGFGYKASTCFGLGFVALTAFGCRHGGGTLFENGMYFFFSMLALMYLIVVGGGVIRSSNEGATKGNLGAVRQALEAYKEDNKGEHLADPATLTVDSYYLNQIPVSKNPPYHPYSSHVHFGAVSDDAGGWLYNNIPKHKSFGTIVVNCTHTDSKGNVWTSY